MQTGKGDAGWQWVKTWFDQTLFIKRRMKLRNLAPAMVPDVSDRHRLAELQRPLSTAVWSRTFRAHVRSRRATPPSGRERRLSSRLAQPRILVDLNPRSRSMPLSPWRSDGIIRRVLSEAF
jgi:hypothetical protein